MEASSQPTVQQGTLAAVAGAGVGGALLGVADAALFLGRTTTETGDGGPRVVAASVVAGVTMGVLAALVAAPLSLWLKRGRGALASVSIVAALAATYVNATVYTNLYPWAHLLLLLFSVGAAAIAGALLTPPGRPSTVLAVVWAVVTVLSSWLGPAFLGDGQSLRQPVLRETVIAAPMLALWPSPPLPQAALTCSFPQPAPVRPSPDSKRRSVLLISIDALRGDPRGPALEIALPKVSKRLAHAARFTRAYASATRTNRSVYSMFTGRWPHRLDFSFAGIDVQEVIHRIAPDDPALRDDKTWKQRHPLPLDDRSPTLANLLADAGYDTATVIPYVFFQPQAGITRGFGEVDNTPYKTRNLDNRGITSDLLTERALDWYGNEKRQKPWMLWLHYMDPHAPYRPYGPVGRDAPRRSRYLAELRRVDDELDRLLAGLDSQGGLEDTIVVLTADHGEEFGDHGGNYHGTSVFEEQVHVPLLFAVPGMSKRTVGSVASLVDVVPTLLDLVGVRTEVAFDGRSLRPALLGKMLPPRPVLALSTLHGRRAAVIEERHKLIVDKTAKSVALFDLTADPRESRNLVDGERTVTARLTCLMEASGVLK